jgi:hypothetical protein
MKEGKKNWEVKKVKVVVSGVLDCAASGRR